MKKIILLVTIIGISFTACTNKKAHYSNDFTQDSSSSGVIGGTNKKHHNPFTGKSATVTAIQKESGFIKFTVILKDTNGKFVTISAYRPSGTINEGGVNYSTVGLEDELKIEQYDHVIEK